MCSRYNVYVGMDTFGFFITPFNIFGRLFKTRLFSLENFPNGIFNSCRFVKFRKGLMKSCRLTEKKIVFKLIDILSFSVLVFNTKNDIFFCVFRLKKTIFVCFSFYTINIFPFQNGKRLSCLNF